KFGTASAYFDGTGDYLDGPNGDTFDFGTGNFTIECWFKFIDPALGGIFLTTDAGTGWSIFGGAGLWTFYVENTKVFERTWSGGDTDWHHLAIVRNGTAVNLYIDGTSIITASSSANIDPEKALRIGKGLHSAYTGSYFDGWMDEIRISNMARWTSDFTPDSTSYSWDSNTLFLAHNDGIDGDQNFTATAAASALTRIFEYDTQDIPIETKTPINIIYTNSPGAGWEKPAGTNLLYGYLGPDKVMMLDGTNKRYLTYDWSVPDQVTVSEYAGAYVINDGDAPLLDVDQGERRFVYEYDHNGEQVDFDTASNGWLMTRKTEYDTNGTTVLSDCQYQYDTQGRLIREDQLSNNIYYTYTYHGTMPLPEYKYEFDSSSNPLATYYNITGSFYTKEITDAGDPDFGVIFTYVRSGDNDLVNTRLDTDGTFTEYRYNSDDALVGAYRYSADRATITELDSSLNTVQVITPSPQFSKGGNLPWLNYGYDFGDGAHGETYEGLATKEAELFAALERWKGGCVRVFVFGDTRAGITFDANGVPTGIDAHVYDDMDKLIEMAEILGIKLIPVLLDFTIADGIDIENDHPVGEDPELITDDVAGGKREALINLMGDFVGHYSTESSIYAWEIMNEPEEVDNRGLATMTELQDFVKAMILELHAGDTDTGVTLGCQDRWFLEQYWEDTVLGVAPADGLDIYQFHYYNYMEAYPEKELDYDMGLSKPVIIGELDPTQNAFNNMTVIERLANIYGNQYAGALFWQDYGTYLDAIDEEALHDIYNWMFGSPSSEVVASGWREWDDVGDIKEHNNNVPSRTVLYYDKSQMKYRTLDWYTSAGQVIVEEHLGVYDPVPGSDLLSDVAIGERTAVYIYNHNSDYTNLDPATNAWTLVRMEHRDPADTLISSYTYTAAGALSNVDFPNAEVDHTGSLIEYYVTGYQMRKVDKRSGYFGNIYEYEDENYYLPGDDAKGYGRTILAYDNSRLLYNTYTWDTFHVTVDEHKGVYEPVAGSALYSDVDMTERKNTYVYIHNGNEFDLDPGTNGWILKEKIVYELDGVTMKEKYTYHPSGRMESKLLREPDDFDNTYYHYMDEDFYGDGSAQNPYYGRVDATWLYEANPTGEVAYSYVYWDDTDTIHFKRAYISTSMAVTDLIIIYEYDSAENFIRKIYHNLIDDNWYVEEDYTTELGDGFIHPRRIDVYDDYDFILDQPVN
ncbi:MAG: LamG domain-containing protein, partial [Candidatus Omnitrophota bacterium]